VQVSASTGFKAKSLRPEQPVVQKSQPSHHDFRDKPGAKGKWSNPYERILDEQNWLDETEELKLFKRVHLETRFGAGSGARPRRGAFVLSSRLGVFGSWSMPTQSSSRRLHPKYRRFPYAESSSDDGDEDFPGFNWLMDKEDK
jgi:hypothetical protein